MGPAGSPGHEQDMGCSLPQKVPWVPTLKGQTRAPGRCRVGPRKRSHVWDFCSDQDTLPQGNGAMFFQPLIKLNP